MIDLKEACKIVCSNNKDMKPISCMELKKFYSFNMIPKKDGTLFGNSSVYLVNKKTGNCEVVYFMKVVNEPILKKFDESDLINLMRDC